MVKRNSGMALAVVCGLAQMSSATVPVPVMILHGAGGVDSQAFKNAVHQKLEAQMRKEFEEALKKLREGGYTVSDKTVSSFNARSDDGAGVTIDIDLAGSLSYQELRALGKNMKDEKNDACNKSLSGEYKRYKALLIRAIQSKNNDYGVVNYIKQLFGR